MYYIRDTWTDRGEWLNRYTETTGGTTWAVVTNCFPAWRHGEIRLGRTVKGTWVDEPVIVPCPMAKEAP